MQEVARIKAEFADVASQEMGAKGAVVEGMDGRQKRPMDERSDRIIGVDKSPVPP